MEILLEEKCIHLNTGLFSLPLFTNNIAESLLTNHILYWGTVNSLSDMKHLEKIYADYMQILHCLRALNMFKGQPRNDKTVS